MPVGLLNFISLFILSLCGSLCRKPFLTSINESLNETAWQCAHHRPENANRSREFPVQKGSRRLVNVVDKHDQYSIYFTPMPLTVTSKVYSTRDREVTNRNSGLDVNRDPKVEEG